MQHHIITGAASGFGFELARILLQRGDSVLASDIQPQRLEKLAAYAAASERLTTLQLDVRSPQQWESVVATAKSQWPRIDTLMNVAGVMHPGFVSEIQPSDVDLHFDVNVKGVVHGTQAAFRVMQDQPLINGLRGHIINLASLAGLSPVPGIALYSASKFAVRGYSLSVGVELRRYNIAMTVVYPDGASTPMLMNYAHAPETALVFTGPRLLTAEDVAHAIVNRGLARRPLELPIPLHRAIGTKLAGIWPGAAGMLLGALMRLGLRRQARLP
ncbi:MAG TPA: SDR family oxidoreductase [Candidatus Angelobacter sp.]|nr:SDR family oxidoreductase [Candidatus Angelobacter sp.]